MHFSYDLSHFAECRIFLNVITPSVNVLSVVVPFTGMANKKCDILKTRAGNTNWRGRLSTVDQIIKIACFDKK